MVPGGNDDIAGDDTVAHDGASDETVTSHPLGSAEQLARGESVGRYTVLERLGAGAMGVVYAAHDAELDRRIAIKLLRAQIDAGPDSRVRMQREAQAMARLSHPNVVAVYDVGSHQDHIFVAMELVDGQTLRQWLAAQRRSWREIREVFIAAGRGLAAAHGAGLVHRDFKPDNVLVDRAGRIRVSDFGLARSAESVAERRPAREKPLDALLTQTGALLGTPAYMSPEQLTSGPTDARSDQFSFCVALYEALYGERPFAGESLGDLSVAVLDGVIRAVARDSKVPPWLRAIVVRGLAVKPEERYATMDELIALLLGDPAVRRRRIAVAALAAVAITGGILAFRAHGTERVDASCAAASERLAGVWDAPTRAAVERGFPFAPAAIATTWRVASGDLDAYAAQWATQWNAACREPDRDSDPLLHAQRLTCLENALLDLRGVVAGMMVDLPSFAAGFAGSFEHASLRDCETTDVLRAQVPAPPPDKRDAVAAALLDLHRLVATVRDELYSMAHYDQFAATIARFEAVGDRLETLGSAVAAEVANAQAQYVIDEVPTNAATYVPQARSLLARALRQGEATRNDASVARTHRLMAELEMADADGDLGRAEDAVAHAEAAEARSGHPEAIAIATLSTRARLEARFGRFDRAARSAREAVTRWTAANTFGGIVRGHGDRRAPWRLLARALAELGQDREALVVAHEALATQLVAFGSDHWTTTDTYEAVADLQQRRDPAGALAELAHASKEVRVHVAGFKFELASMRFAIAARLGDDAVTKPAADELHRLTAEHPGRDPWFQIGVDMQQVGALEGAAYAFAQTTTVESALFSAGVAGERGDYATMQAVVARWAFLPDSADLDALRGTTAAVSGDVANAERYLARFPPDMAKTRAIASIDRTLILIELGRWPEARAELETARAVHGVWMRDRRPHLAEIDGWLGVARVETGDAKGALLPLEESLEQLTQVSFGFNYYSPNVELALARALWETGGDKARARRLAERARLDAVRLGTGRDRDRLAAVAWLTEHQEYLPALRDAFLTDGLERDPDEQLAGR